MNQSKSDSDKEDYFRILQKLTPQAKRRELELEGLRYLSHWLHPVIREMVSLSEFRDDPYWISRRITGKASVSEINKALQFLIKEGFIQRSSEGRFVATDNMIFSKDEVKSLAIRNYHRSMLDLAKEKLEDLPIEEREFGALTFVLPESGIQELKYKIKTFRSDLHTWAMQVANEQKGDVIAQVNIHMYPHTKKVET